MSDSKFLKNIHQPSDIRGLDYTDIAALNQEIRTCLIRNISNNGGHLASNLGVVELTTALHRVFDSPRDQIIFDVGHQCYVHKLLTGRYEKFQSLRMEDGLSGFPNPLESAHDILKTGHSSTAISSATGLLRAFQLRGELDRCVVAVVGDGAMTGGLSYEGLNNGGKMHGRLIVVLNDNDMSISANVGSFAAYLSKIRSRQGYFRFKDVLTRAANATPLIGKWIYRFFHNVKQALKRIFYQGNIFEDMGFAYLGPIDGHNQKALERVLIRAKNLKKPCLVHVKTIKGKGYSYAENQPVDFHGLSSFDILTGEHGQKNRSNFSDVFGQTLCSLAEKDEKICAITAAMCTGCGLTDFSERYPERFFDVGIAEQHALTFAGGMARNGMKPVFVVYSSFLQRGFDQVIHDLALQGVAMTICIDRAGIVGEDGETHQGLFDIPMLLPVPGVSIYTPATYEDLRAIMRRRVPNGTGITAIRYPRGYEPEAALPFCCPEENFEWLSSSAELCVISYGRQGVACLEGINTSKIQADFLKLNRIFPLDEAVIERISHYQKVLFVEECYQRGGIGTYLGNELINRDFRGIYRNIGITNQFLKSGKPADLLQECRLDSSSIAASIQNLMAENP